MFPFAARRSAGIGEAEAILHGPASDQSVNQAAEKPAPAQWASGTRAWKADGQRILFVRGCCRVLPAVSADHVHRDAEGFPSRASRPAQVGPESGELIRRAPTKAQEGFKDNLLWPFDLPTAGASL